MGFEMEVEEGLVSAPERIAMLGEAGIGKSTFAESAPRPFFLDIERGSLRLKYASRNKTKIELWTDLLAGIEWLRTAKHPYMTAVLDTLDRAEWLCWKYLCERDSVGSIDEVAKGYGRGYNAAYEEFRKLFAELERLVEERSMHIIILAHQKNEKVRNPTGADYERYGFKVHTAIGGLMYEACDHVLFARRNTIVTDDMHDDGRARAIGGTKRMLHTVGTPAYVAKTRAAVPDPMPLSWHDWVCHVANAGFPRLLRETVRDNARRLGDPDTKKKIEAMLADSAGDVKLLARANAKLIKLLGVPSNEEEPPPPPKTETKGEPAKTESKGEPAKTEASTKEPTKEGGEKESATASGEKKEQGQEGNNAEQSQSA